MPVVRLCHLCRIPVVDGGVRIQSLDQKKLSKWWLQNLQTEFEYVGMKTKSICMFCVWDARLLHENNDHERSNEEIVWWPENKSSNEEYEKYYLTGKIKPCCVKLEKFKKPSRPKTIKIADKPLIYKCYFCNDTRLVFPLLLFHINKKHPEKTFIICDYVACLHLFFTSDEEKKKHVEEHHSSNSDDRKVLRCVYCDKMYLDRGTLSAHVKVTHQKIILKCIYWQCGEYFKSEADRRQHLNENHNKGENARKCVYCDKVFKLSSSLWSHTFNVHRNILVICNYAKCGTFFKCEKDRQKHVEEKHRTNNRAKKCVYCEKWVRCMKQHVFNKHSHVAIKCKYSVYCFTYFTSESDRDEHVKAVHMAGKEKQILKCLYCDESYPKGAPMTTHVMCKHGGIAIRCSLRRCNQYFINQEDCAKHFREAHHDREKLKTILCHKCNFKTINELFLNNHLRNKHGKERFKCTQCPTNHKTYRSTEALNMHIQTTHLFMEICPHCNKLMNKYRLPKHLLTEYCSFCNIKYLCSGTMTRHKIWCKRK